MANRTRALRRVAFGLLHVRTYSLSLAEMFWRLRDYRDRCDTIKGYFALHAYMVHASMASKAMPWSLFGALWGMLGSAAPKTFDESKSDAEEIPAHYMALGLVQGVT